MRLTTAFDHGFDHRSLLLLRVLAPSHLISAFDHYSTII
jgi:hypothetical protein